MTKQMNEQKTATIDELAKALGMKTDFVAAANMTPDERGKALRDFHKKSQFRRNVVISAGLSLIAGTAGLLFYLSNSPQIGYALIVAPGCGFLLAAGVDTALNSQIPCPRAVITARAQLNILRAYNAPKLATPDLSP